MNQDQSTAQPITTPAQNTSPTPEQNHPGGKDLHASNVLLVIGIVLVIVAAIVIIFSQWSQIGPFGHFCAIAVPNIILFLLGTFLKSPETENAKEGCTATALLMLPVTVGTFLYQFKIIDNLDYPLFIWSTLAALPVFIIYDFLKKKSYPIIFVILNGLAALIFILLQLKVEESTAVFVFFVLGISLFAISLALKKVQDSKRLVPFATVAATILFFATPTFFYQLYFPNGTSYASISDILGPSLLGGGVLLFIAMLQGKLFKPWTNLEWALQRFILFGAMIALFVPLFMISADEKIYSILTIIIGIILLILGMLVDVNLLFICGLIGLSIGIIIPLVASITSIAVPILIFIIGFILIGVSIFIAKSKFAKKMLYSPVVAEKIGMIGDAKRQEFDQANHEKKKTSWLMICAIIFLLLFVVPAIVSSVLSNIYRQKSEKQNAEIMQQIQTENAMTSSAVTTLPISQ